MSIVGLIVFIGLVTFVVVALVKIAWPHIPLLPGLFEDMANGYSYDREGNRL
jgi:uncharacterized membrane protein YagU involved in acid resistance